MATPASKIVIMPLDVSATFTQSNPNTPDMQTIIALMQAQQQAYANQINLLEIMINQYTWWIGLVATLVIAILSFDFTWLQFFFQSQNKKLLVSGVNTLQSAQEADSDILTQRDLGLYFSQNKEKEERQAPIDELPSSSIKKPKKNGGNT